MLLTDKERLNICKTCKKKKFDPESGLLCSLTDRKPDFLMTCDDYEVDPIEKEKQIRIEKQRSQSQAPKESSSFSWRTLLSVVIAIIAIIRLANTCNKLDTRSSNNRSDYRSTFVENEYTDQMSQISMDMKEELGVKYISRDTLLDLDENLQFLLPKNSYLFEEMTNEHVIFFGRNKLNCNMAIYKFPKPLDDTPEKIWYNFRKAATDELMDTEITYRDAGQNRIAYNLKNSLLEINGKAKFIDKDDYLYIYQFEGSLKNIGLIYDHFKFYADQSIKHKK